MALLDTFNYGARAWAIRALAGIGDPRGLDILLEAASNDFALSVRRAAAHGLGTIRWSEMPLEQQLRAQIRSLEVLLGAAQDPEWVVRYAAITGIQSLGLAVTEQMRSDLFPESDAKLTHILKQLEHLYLQEQAIAVRARILMAQHQLQLALSKDPKDR